MTYARKTKSRKESGGLLPHGMIDTAVERSLSARTKALIEASESESTRDAYAYWWLAFLEFCDAYGGVDGDGAKLRGLTSLPATAETLAEFAGHLAHLDYKPNSIRVALAAVKRRHRVEGHSPPDSIMANAVVHGYEDQLIAAGWRPDRAPVARLSVIERLVAVCPLDSPAGLRDRALVTLGYGIAGRRRALANLNVTDVEDLGNAGLQVKVWRDKGGADRSVTVPHLSDRPRGGWCSDPVCPVCCTKSWIELLGTKGVRSGALFRPVDRHGNVAGADRLAGGESHDPRLSVDGVTHICARLARAAGVAFRPHSMRAGFATESYENGADELAIRRHGGWADDSSSFYVYIRDVQGRRNSPMAGTSAARARARRGAARGGKAGGDRSTR